MKANWVDLLGHLSLKHSLVMSYHYVHSDLSLMLGRVPLGPMFLRMKYPGGKEIIRDRLEDIRVLSR